MKFLSFIFNIESRHYREIHDYGKGKIGTKIFAIILQIIFVAITLGVELWVINLFETEILYSLLAGLLLFLPLIAVTLEYCLLYCYIGFKSFMFGSLDSVITKLEAKRNKKKGLDQNPNIDQVEETQNLEPTKSHKWLDLVVAIFSLLLFAATLVIGVYLILP